MKLDGVLLLSLVSLAAALRPTPRLPPLTPPVAPATALLAAGTALLAVAEPAAAASADIAWVGPTKLVLQPLLTIGTLAFLFRVVLSWFPKYDLKELPWSLVAAPTEPILKPTRLLIPPVGGVVRTRRAHPAIDFFLKPARSCFVRSARVVAGYHAHRVGVHPQLHQRGAHRATGFAHHHREKGQPLRAAWDACWHAFFDTRVAGCPKGRMQPLILHQSANLSRHTFSRAS